MPAELHPVPLDHLIELLDERTVALRYSDEQLQHWGTTQAWRWSDGDAILVLVGSTMYVVIRYSTDLLRTVRAPSVRGALAKVGLNPDEFTVKK